jgi:hypothetical protein
LTSRLVLVRSGNGSHRVEEPPEHDKRGAGDNTHGHNDRPTGCIAARLRDEWHDENRQAGQLPRLAHGVWMDYAKGSA